MTDYPCVTDTATIAQIVEAAYHADLILDDDTTNALLIDSSRGLFAPFGTCEAGRGVRTSATNVTTGDSLGMSSARWDTTNGKIATNAGPSMQTSRNGIWLVGGSFAFNTGAAIGQVTAQLICGSTTVAYDSAASPAAFAAGTAETIALNPCGIVQAPAGASITTTFYHNFGGTIPTVGSTTVPPTTVGAGIESGGMEWWAVLLKAL